MRYELMFPHQIRRAIRQNWPVVLAVGVLEYHSEHCAVGTDTLIINRVIDELEKTIPMVVLPPLFYGAASFAVAPPEHKGTIHISSEVLHVFGKDLFRSLLRGGFRNIHAFVWHQSENFTDGMPTDLALKLAARETLFEFLENCYGEGWWGKNNMSRYYDDHEKGADPFGWISFHPLMDSAGQKRFPADHAGKLETSLLMALCPECQDMKKHSGKHWFAREAKNAGREYGLAAKKAILGNMRKILTGKSK